jgi:hypothetical protein
MATTKVPAEYHPVLTEDGSLLVVDAATVETVDDDPYTDGDEVEEKKTLARGAAAFFGGLGCILGGPLLAIAAAVAAVHTATHNSGGFGDATRSMGKVALDAHLRAKDMHLYEKGGRAIKGVATRVEDSIRGGTSTSNSPPSVH